MLGCAKTFAALALSAAVSQAQSPRPAIFYDHEIPQLHFAASEAGSSFRRLTIGEWSRSSCSPCVLVVIKPGAALPQSYSIRHSDQRYTVTAPDANGAMYGMLDLIEADRLGTLRDLKDGDHTPYIARRGIKFN